VSRQYFATLPIEEFLNKAIEKIKRFDEHLEHTGMARRAEKSEQLYYGRHLGEQGAGTGQVTKVGEDDELSAFGVNIYRNLIQHRMALTTSQKLSYDPRAVNSDLDSLQQTRLGRNVLDYYESRKRLAEVKTQAAERALVGAIGYVYMGWDKRSGKPIGTAPVMDKQGQPVVTDTGETKERLVYEGDVFARPKSLTDVVFDPQVRDWSQNNWVIVEDLESRGNLMAEHPDHEDDIDSFNDDEGLRGRSSNRKFQTESDDQDFIPVYHFYHLKTDAVPQGRYVKFISGKVSLYDGPIPYQDKFESFLPVMRIAAGEVFGSAFGHTDAFDTMSLQQVLNVLYSTVFTNQQAFGVQMVNLPDGSSVTPSHVKGLAFIKTPPGTEAKGINLTNTPAEIFKNIEMVKQVMTEIQGLNSVVTGDPDHNLKSGAALGRLQAMAIQFASNFQRQWAGLNEECGSFLLKLLKWFAKSERMVALAGKRNQNSMESFTGDKLSLVDRVTVDLGSPMTQTGAGRAELADGFLEKGLITAQQYMEVLETGTTDFISEDEISGEENMQRENERLMEGKPVLAMVGDKHKRHAKRHRSLLDDPQLREAAASGDPQATAVVQAVLNHVQEHEQLENTQLPFWFAVSGEEAPPPPMPPPMPGPDGQMPPPPPNGGPQGPGDLPPPPEAPPIPPMPGPMGPPI
jgi:hypothetical protein